jgi:molybdopterin/thiamine biosynthesis adenylyltransferase
MNVERDEAYFHERRYRSDPLMARLRGLAVTVCGAGALGANLTETLARQGFAQLRVIDRDRVEERNLSTQPYHRSDVGAFKAKILANALYRALGVAVDARAETLTPANARKLLGGSAVVVDTFDNSGSRQAVRDWCAAGGTPCLHVGLAGDYAEAIWDPVYRVPSPSHDDVCDYPLARNLVLLATAVAAEALVAFAARGEQPSHTITLADLAIRPFAP